MSVQHLVLACSSTPQAVAGSAGSGATSFHGVIRVRLKAISGTAYLGDSGVTTGGFPLSTGDSLISEILYPGETLWAASSSGASVSLGILRMNETT